jgi:hypothetical protein
MGVDDSHRYQVFMNHDIWEIYLNFNYHYLNIDRIDIYLSFL